MGKFDGLTQFLDSLSDRFGVPACDLALTIDAQPVYRHSAGYADLEGKRPVSPQDTYWIYSASKLFTCTAALRLMEAGKLELDAPVSRYLPEFGSLTVLRENGTVSPARNIMTVRCLMNMTGGLDYNYTTRPALREALQAGACSTREIVSSLARDPLSFEPGTHFQYSLCHDVLGAVIEVASGESFAQYVDNEIIRPLGMKDTTFHPNQEQLSRLSMQYVHLDMRGSCKPIERSNPFRFTEAYESGGAGLISTVDDYIRLVAALSLGGTSPEGYRLLTPESIAQMGSEQLGPLRQEFYEGSPRTRGDYSYGLGVRVRTKAGKYGIPVGEFGWDGAAGAYTLVDPVNRIALFYAQHVCQSSLTIQFLHPELRDIVYRCLEDTL